MFGEEGAADVGGEPLFEDVTYVVLPAQRHTSWWRLYSDGSTCREEAFVDHHEVFAV